LQSIINQTRITTPKVPEGIIRRNELLEKLRENRNKKLLLITGPAGYGKTTLTIDHIYGSITSYAWMQIKKDIADIYLFFRYVIASLQKVKSDFGTATIKLISQIEEDSSKIPEPERAIDQITGLFTNEFISCFEEDVTLVLDDLHEIISYSWHKYLLESLINETPYNLHIAITSRSQPEINLSSIRSKRNLFEVTKKDLLFARNEIELLAKDLYSKVYNEDELNYLETFIGGWVTGIHLMIQAHGDSITEGHLIPGFIPENLFDYFANEIFEKQSEEIKRFLIQTAHFDEFSEDLCNSLPGIKRSSGTLKYLSGKNIFIEILQHDGTSSGQELKYSYNQLFRNFLLNKSSKELSPNELSKLYSTIAAVYEERGSFDEASKYYLLSGDQVKAEELLRKCFFPLFHNGQYGKLWDLVSAFPEKKVSASSQLLYYSALLWKYYKGNLDIALDFVNKAIDKTEIDSDENFTILCIITKSELLLNQSKANEVMEILTKHEGREIAPENEAKILFYLGNANFASNKYDVSETYLKKALELCEKHSLSELEPDIFHLLGSININKGEFVLSKHYFELTISKTNSLYKKLVASGNLAILYSRNGRFQKAKEYLDEAKELIVLFSTPIIELVTIMIEYTLTFETADYNSSLLLAKEVNEGAKKLNINNYVSLSFQFLGEVSYYSGNPSNSISYYRIAEKYIDDSNESEKLNLEILKNISQKDIFISPGNEEFLLRAYASQDATGYNYDKTSTGYFLALYYYQSGQLSTALEYFHRSIALAKEKEYYGFLIREYLHNPVLFDLSIANNSEKVLIRSLVDQVKEISDLNWISPSHRDALRSKLMDLYDIRLRAFGNPEFMLKGKIIDESKWKRKKYKLLLCMLFVSNNRQLTKDRIIDVFFQDASVESSDNLFHQAVSNIRSSLKTGKETKDSNKTTENYILYEGKSLKLNPDYLYYSDIEEFDSLINDSIVAVTNSDRITYLKSAIELYRGDLFEGFYEDWCETLREEYRNKYIICMEKLLYLFEVENSLIEIPVFAEKLILSDKLNSTAYFSIIWSLFKQGKKQSARDKYEQYKKIYKTELDEDIPKEIKKKLDNILT
jgi:LuxR family transcriptional regulator, maltose regulon positive regulatory protein